MKLLKQISVIGMITSSFYAVDAKDGLIKAVQSGDINIVDRVADESTVNQTDGATTPLHEAVKLNDQNEAIQIATLLIDRGANVDARGERRATALHLAAALGNELMVKLLVQRGANIQLADEQGKTALFYAVKFPKIQMLLFDVMSKTATNKASKL